MGVIQIRRSQSQLGNLPNVKMVDTSGLATSSARGLETLGEGLTKGIIGTMKGVSDIAEWQLKMQEKENALITNEKLAKADEYIQRRLYDPNEGVLQMLQKDEDQVPSYLHDPATLQGNIKREVENYIGYDQVTNPQQKRLLDLKLRSIYTNVNKTLNVTANNIATSRSQAASKKAVEYGIKNLAREPDEVNLQDFETFVNEYCDANFISGEMRPLVKMELYEKAMADIVKESIARCQTTSDLHAVKGWLEREDFGSRSSGEPKGAGWLGVLKTKNGSEETEYPVGIQHTDLTGAKHNVDIPLIVPTLTEEEIHFLLNDYIPADGDKDKQEEMRDSLMYKTIFRKAVQHATPLLDEGKSAFAPSPFGAMDKFVDLLPESERTKLISSLDKELSARAEKIQEEQSAQRANWEKACEDSITGFKIQLAEGGLDYDSLDMLFNQAMAEGWSNDNVLALQKLRDEAKSQRVNKLVAQVTLNPSNYVKEGSDGGLSFEGIPQYLAEDPDAMLHLYNAYTLGAKREKDLRDGAVEAMLDTIIFSGGSFGDTIEQREEAIWKLAREGRLSHEKATERINTLNKVFSDRFRPVFDEIAFESPFFSMVSLTKDADGSLVPDVNKTYKAFASRFGDEVDPSLSLNATRKYTEIFKDFYKWAKANPNATDEELINAFKLRAQTMLPLLTEIGALTPDITDVTGAQKDIVKYFFMNENDPYKKVFNDPRYNNPFVMPSTNEEGITTVQPRINPSASAFVDAWIGGEHLTTKPSKEDDDETNVQ